MDEKDEFSLIKNSGTDSIFLSNLLPSVTINPSLIKTLKPLESPFDEACKGDCEHKPDFYSQNIDFKKLADDLSASDFFSKKFIAANYVSGSISAGISSAGIPVFANVSAATGIRYINNAGKTTEALYYGRLNRVNCCVEDVINLSIAIKKSSIVYTAQWYYKEVQNYIRYLGDKYTIDDKYIAIEVNTTNYEDLTAFIIAVSTGQFNRKGYIDAFKKRVVKDFAAAFKKNEGNAAQLKFLYENAPDFVIPPVGEIRLWHDLLLLLDYDDKGVFSGWRDGSNAIIKIVKNFPSADYLFEKLNANGKLVKRIYSGLDGSQKINGEEINNKDFFCILLSALNGLNKKAVYTGKVFTIGKGYGVDSNINSDNDAQADKILLQQQRVEEEYVDATTTDEFGITEKVGTKKIGVLKNQGEGIYFNPLDMVILKDAGTGEEEYVPALYVKLLADNAEWEHIKLVAAITILIISIIVSAGTLITAATAATVTLPGVIIAAADLIVAVTDLTMLSLKDVLDEKNWFVQNWDKISIAVGAATLSPLLVKGILKNGPKLMNAINTISKGPGVKNFIHSAIAAAIVNIEIANFTKSTLKVISSGYEASKSSSLFSFTAITRLQKQGVLFIKGQMSVNKAIREGYAVFYRGEMLVSGNAKTIMNSLDDVFKATAKNVSEVLDNFTYTTGLIKLGRSRLSNIALDYRLALADPFHDGNIAVFEYFVNGKLTTKAFTTLTEKEWKAAGYIRKLHAEEIGIDWLRKENISAVEYIYSELEPCMLKQHRYKQELAENFPNAKVSYTYPYTNNSNIIKKATLDRKKDLQKILKNKI